MIDTDGLICQALLTGNFEAAVDVCFKDGRSSEGLLLAIAGGPDLFARTQKRYLDQTATTVARVSKLFVSVIESASLILMFYSKLYIFTQIFSENTFFNFS